MRSAPAPANSTALKPGPSKVSGHVRAQGGEVLVNETAFDYRAAAELFPTRSRKPGRHPIAYKRFDTAAAAVRFAIEELPAELLQGAYLQVQDDRFDSDGIRRLYDSERYPLKRRAASPR